MLKLMLFNLLLLLIITVLLIIVKKTVKSEKGKNVLLLVSAAVTIIFHYSTLIFHCLTGGEAIEYLKNNPNLILPIYPCNVVMWSCLLFGFLKKRDSSVSKLLTDYIFWFGIFSTLVGMFANVDFIKNPTLADYEITKSIVAHATLLFNVLLLPLFGYIKIDVKRNITNIIISIFVMGAIGGYCNLVFYALSSAERAYDVNSMFLIHSPFSGLDFLTYPVIALIAVPIYLAVFFICGFFVRKIWQRKNKRNSTL